MNIEVSESLIKLSICIATYNRGAFISETLDCILTQIEPGVEIVVVDGASADNTSDVMVYHEMFVLEEMNRMKT